MSEDKWEEIDLETTSESAPLHLPVKCGYDWHIHLSWLEKSSQLRTIVFKKGIRSPVLKERVKLPSDWGSTVKAQLEAQLNIVSAGDIIKDNISVESETGTFEVDSMTLKDSSAGAMRDLGNLVSRALVHPKLRKMVIEDFKKGDYVAVSYNDLPTGLRPPVEIAWEVKGDDAANGFFWGEQFVIIRMPESDPNNPFQPSMQLSQNRGKDTQNKWVHVVGEGVTPDHRELAFLLDLPKRVLESVGEKAKDSTVYTKPQREPSTKEYWTVKEYCRLARNAKLTTIHSHFGRMDSTGMPYLKLGPIKPTMAEKQSGSTPEVLALMSTFLLTPLTLYQTKFADGSAVILNACSADNTCDYLLSRHDFASAFCQSNASCVILSLGPLPARASCDFLESLLSDAMSSNEGIGIKLYEHKQPDQRKYKLFPLFYVLYGDPWCNISS